MKTAVILIGLVAAATACSDPPRVLQGKVESYDASSHILLVRDEVPPNAVIELSTAGAEIGAEPANGDLVRIAYREREGKAVAGRVMNLTRQAEVKGGGGH